eukprot:scaffold34838_cov84-Isochrysis_galbana.AAC.1
MGEYVPGCEQEVVLPPSLATPIYGLRHAWAIYGRAGPAAARPGFAPPFPATIPFPNTKVRPVAGLLVGPPRSAGRGG